jgi:hypothetical protein
MSMRLRQHHIANRWPTASQITPGIAARGSLRTNTAESIAQLTGGEAFHFHDAKDLKAGLISVSNDLPNYYVLSFRPTSLRPGLHALRLEIKDRHEVVLKSRSEYWIANESGR